jgi:hypothetical protein
MPCSMPAEVLATAGPRSTPDTYCRFAYYKSPGTSTPKACSTLGQEPPDWERQHSRRDLVRAQRLPQAWAKLSSCSERHPAQRSALDENLAASVHFLPLPFFFLLAPPPEVEATVPAAGFASTSKDSSTTPPCVRSSPPPRLFFFRALGGR